MNIGGSASAERASERERSRQTESRTGLRTEQLKLDESAIQKIIEDVLSGPEGLANIFAGEQTAGIFSSSVAAQAAGDLAANLVGEIAKLTGVREVREQEDVLTEAERKTVGKKVAAESSFKLF